METVAIGEGRTSCSRAPGTANESDHTCVWFPGAARIQDPKRSGLTHRNLFFHHSKSSKFEINVWEGPRFLSPRALGKNLACFFLASGAAGNPCLEDPLLLFLGPSSHDCLLSLCVCFPVSKFLLRDHQPLNLGPILLQDDLILT